MSKSVREKREHIQPEMTVLDIVSKYRRTEIVFNKYDEQVGECICFRALFAKVLVRSS